MEKSMEDSKELRKDFDKALDEFMEGFAFQVPYNGTNDFYSEERLALRPRIERELKSIWAKYIEDGWIDVKDGLPEIVEDGVSDEVLCLGFKMSRPESARYELMRWTKLWKPELLDSLGKPIEYGWSVRWWDTNPDLFEIHYWMPLPEPPKV